MEFPFGHHHHHHHRSEEEEEKGRNPYPPPSHQPYSQPSNEYPPPPPPSYGTPGYPPVQHVAHEPGHGYAPPPPGSYGTHGGQPVSHPYPHSQAPSQAHHASHESHNSAASIRNQPTVRVYTKAEENYSLSIRDGKVVLARANPRDEYQHWIKDLKYSTRVKDAEGFPGFALVNKVTGEAIKHSIGATHPVRLVPYNPDYLDESILWAESSDTGEGFRCIRMVNNIELNFDAFNGDEDHGGVHDGTIIVLWEWTKGKNQRWKITPY
ncbi:Dynamin GTPase protein [Dioscorea alata]|uniref:Dynamin GTPase protein n=1 Tax=Dioscorea alata TaxID=55571 RepID=A0ACB7VTF3_DIOAL|nr:Dynamin GTPase protein [Dioscorea alata]